MPCTVIVTLHAPTEKIRSQSIVIERISLAEPTRSLFPVVDEKGLSPHFRTSNQPLWTNQHGTIPASIDLTSGNVVYIDVTIRAHPWIHLLVAKISGAPNFFSGNVDIEGNRDSSSIVNTEGIDLATYRCSMKFPVPNTHATISPWGFAKEISWWIVFPMNKGKVTFSARVNPSATVIELYAVSPWLHPSLVKEGIPLQLLRFALLQILDLPQFPTDFAAYITGRVYKDTGFIYDTFHGSPSYMNNDGQFNLHMWLRDFAILHNGMSDAAKYCDYKKFPPTVNCYDQAGILAFCIGLGFPDEKSSKQLFRAYMVPYGFITPTHLVGWPDFETNNPFFRGQKRAASLPPDDENRDPFGNHMFLLYRNKALDACAGPHRGDETLADYIKNAIDLRHKSRTYDSSHDFIVRPDGCAGDVRVRPVLALHDKMDTTIDPIGHVRRIYGQFLIRKTTEANTNHFYIPLDELPDYLQSHLPSPTFTQASGIFKDISKTDYVIVPDPNGVRYGGFLTYSMNYTFNGDGYPVDIDWHVCLSTGAALQVLAQVTSNSTSLTRFKEVLVNGQSFYCTPRSEDRFAMTAFSYGPHTVVLDSHIGTDGLIPIAQSVLAFIKSNEGKDTTNDAFLKQNDDPEKMIPNTSVILKQGEVYTWTTKVRLYFVAHTLLVRPLTGMTISLISGHRFHEV